MCNCTSENPEIPRCAIAHLRSGAAHHPGMTPTITGCISNQTLRLASLRRSRPVGRPAKNPATALAQIGALPPHARRDPFHAGNFRCAEPEDIASAESPLIVLRKGAARRRQHRHAEHQAGHEREISEIEFARSHRCPPKKTDVAVVDHAVHRVGINHDRIESIAAPSTFARDYAPISRLRIASARHGSGDGTC
jgi:hypothetical protein